MRFWPFSIFHGFWSPKSHEKSIKSGNFGDLGPEFPDFGWILAAAFFDDFLVGFYIDQNSKIVGTLGPKGHPGARPGGMSGRPGEVRRG